MCKLYSDSRSALKQEIDRWERRELDVLSPPDIDPGALLGTQPFIAIRGLALRREERSAEKIRAMMTDLVIAAHGYESYLYFVFSGTGTHVSLHCSLQDPATTVSLLRAAYPGVRLVTTPEAGLGRSLRQSFSFSGRISGIPSGAPRLDYDSDEGDMVKEPMDRIIRGMRDGRWVVVVRGYPRRVSEAMEARDQLLERMADVASLSRRHVQRSSQSSSALTNRTTDMTSDTLSADLVNRRAEYAVELMEIETSRLTHAVATGPWQVGVYFGAAEKADARRLGALLRGVLNGPGSRPDPIRAHFCTGGRNHLDAQFDTYLTSDELAVLLSLPREEAPGYELTELPRFDVDVQPTSGECANIGEVLWDGRATGVHYKLRINDLTRHTLVVGVTGSGKTTTVMNLITEVRTKAGAAFLVIEPAKTEYRALMGKVTGGHADGPIPDLRVFTLGDETLAPFRLNPFEFDCGQQPGGPQLLSHIDLLKAIFNAAFVLYAPMPYVLETALHEVYEDKGWNLATGVNVRLPPEAWDDRDQFPIFPTISDLYNKIEPITARLGYESRIAQDVVAGLKARVGSLRLGSKGLMLDTPRGVSIAELLAQPTVLELESIGNDEEKTFLMGLILTRLYSFRRIQSIEGRVDEGLRHLLVIEEAHRLLKNTSTQVDTEVVNLRAQAIETFVNMLSEVRHYGQGVLVAEQIPAKLTPDVVKNTNLKIVHRLLARDDRELLAGTMAMGDAHTKHLSVLNTGEAVVYAEGNDSPFLLKTANYKADQRIQPPAREALRRHAVGYVELQWYLPVTDLTAFGIKTGHFGAPDPVIIQSTTLRLSDRKAGWVWASIIAKSIFARESLLSALRNARASIYAEPGHLTAAQVDDAFFSWLVFGSARAIEERRAERGWTYPQAAKLFRLLATGLVKLARVQDLSCVTAELDRFARAYEADLTKDNGPFPGCLACLMPCVYHPEVTRLGDGKDVANVRRILTGAGYRDRTEQYRQLAALLGKAGRQWLGVDNSDAKNLGYCAGLYAATALGLDQFEQDELARDLAPHLVC